MAETEASGDFNDLQDDLQDDLHDDLHEDPQAAPQVEYLPDDPTVELYSDPDDELWVKQQLAPPDPVRFDAFNTTTWNFKPAPTPWYRTTPAMLGLITTAIAAVALVVSGVLLLFRGPADDAGPPAAPSSTTPTSAAPATTSRPAPPPPPPETSPPPAPETSAPPANRAPSTYWPSRPRQTKKPEIGVTRTPETRSPISVAPKPRPGSSRN